ncbi:NADH-ubiquinone/plastoquinone oxidoreductase chain 3 [Thermobaculum terrenum ATCC BAA-798]|uniref:NADH-quinone oxidoreductase subunit A n=1 Tax=Thermobaculum terrenum (strain ATCC BAA-798 / CCMEE 7001 / YNP1) TaxID=525904 RepID=D1CCD5_THET1|nr:NADH-quinone oxidoreductase subunit A [Thermobaculum terrenum]ACZ42450.1 NADH-ubiquinone/plastoquinone oxidoreductase chain 3 [Thermobaculum terrenum ATCC BAA-798]
MLTDYVPIGVLFLLVAAFAIAALALSYALSPKRPNPVKAETYESGIKPTGTAQHRYDIRYYTVAMLFVLFDIEAIFLYPWAVVYDRIGLYGLVEMLLFIVLLIIAYAYAWRKGALEWS